MTSRKRNGFTIIELVIVIAVIAVLSAVLIPTFVNVIEGAHNSSRDSKARNAYSDFITSHPTEDNSYLFIEIEDGSKTYYYSVIDGKIDLDHEAKNLSVEGVNRIECNGYAVYTKSANALWLEKWDDIVNGDKEINRVLIIYSNPLSSISAELLIEKQVKENKTSDFVQYIKEQKIEFEEVSFEHEEYKGIGFADYQVVMASENSSDAGEDKHYYTHFVVNKNGYIFAITGTTDSGSPYAPVYIYSKNGSRVLKSKSPIENSIIDEYFKNHAE